MPRPVRPKIYHIVHVDRLAAIVAAGGLSCDADMAARTSVGTTIGMTDIKSRRLRLPLESHPDIMVGACVPFYFCPRSVMLYLIYRANHPNLAYRGGQDPIVHLEADLLDTVAWAAQHGHRWAFTLSNAGSGYFEDRCDLAQLDEINWDAVQATRWTAVSHGKQAEFLIHKFFPWSLVERIVVRSRTVGAQASHAMEGATHRPLGQVLPEWYY